MAGIAVKLVSCPFEDQQPMVNSLAAAGGKRGESAMQLQVAVTYVSTAPPISVTLKHLNNSSSNSSSGCTCAAICSTALC